MNTLALFAALAVSGWGSGGCGPVGPSRFFAPTFTAQATAPTSLPIGRGGLCSDHCTCGCNDDGPCPCTGQPARAKSAPAPTAKPAEATPDEDATPNFGIVVEQMGKGPGYRVNGHPATRAQALDALQAGAKDVPDDAAKLRLTVIGAEGDRKQVLNDLAGSPLLAEWKTKLLAKGYDPTHWAVQGAGYVTAGKPTIYLQDAAGKVLHRQDDYAGGPEQLAAALRKADPDYKPDKDQDRRKPTPLPSPFGPGGIDLAKIPPLAYVAALAGGLLLFRKGRSA